MSQLQRSSSAPRPSITPPVDIFESDAEYQVVADLPGVRSEDVSLDLERGELTLVAERKLGRESEPLSAERRDGDFRRVFRLPDEVDATQVEATFDDGVLHIRLPKSERVRPRRIEVNTVS